MIAQITFDNIFLLIHAFYTPITIGLSKSYLLKKWIASGINHGTTDTAMCQSHDISDWVKQQNVSLLNNGDLLKYRRMHL